MFLVLCLLLVPLALCCIFELYVPRPQLRKRLLLVLSSYIHPSRISHVLSKGVVGTPLNVLISIGQVRLSPP